MLSLALSHLLWGPLLAAGLLLAAGRALGVRGGAALLAAVGLGQLLSLGALAAALLPAAAPAAPPLLGSYGGWFTVGELRADWGFLLDGLALPMASLVVAVSLATQAYSHWYLAADPALVRFQAYLNVFTAAMLALVTAANFATFFLGWEGVGVCSYLLIGFWCSRPEARAAALKAVAVNRLGDSALLAAVGLLASLSGGLAFGLNFGLLPLFGAVALPLPGGGGLGLLPLANGLLLVAIAAKSAQLGLHGWLADAMEGPTPVSALIHAATMVTAGIYLALRCSPLFALTPAVGEAMALLGGATALFGAAVAAAQWDLKKVIAYSTASQLGYMLCGCGLGGYGLAFHHLLAHGVRRFTASIVGGGGAGGRALALARPVAGPAAMASRRGPAAEEASGPDPVPNVARPAPMDVKHPAYRVWANQHGSVACRKRRAPHSASSYRNAIAAPRPHPVGRREGDRSLYWARLTNPFFNHSGGSARPLRRRPKALPAAGPSGANRWGVKGPSCGASCGTPMYPWSGCREPREPASKKEREWGGPKGSGWAVFGGNARSADPRKGASRRSLRSSITHSGGSRRPQRGVGLRRCLATANGGAKGGRDYQWSVSGATVLEQLATLRPLEDYGPEGPLPDLRPLVCHPYALYAAYDRIRSKPGGATPAVGPQTLDGIAARDLRELSRQLSTGAFTFAPARRVSVPKPSGGKRPLTVAAPRDKIVQEALRAVLEPLFEPSFSPHSHGFRPGRGCHSALREVKLGFRGMAWFLEVDIQDCFGSIDHQRLMALLRSRGLTSEVVTSLLWKGLRGKVVELAKDCQARREGTPQGSVLSPLLANSYLDQVDRWLSERARRYHRGAVRARNRLYDRQLYAIRRARSRRERQRLRAELRKSGETPLLREDPGFRRLRWVRYADDILIGVAGPRSEVVALREELAVMLASIGLRLSTGKTLITRGHPARVNFLGHRIGTADLRRAPVGEVQRGGLRVPMRLSPRPVLYGDVRGLVLKLGQRGYCRRGIRGVPTGVGRLIYLPEPMIVAHFRTLYLSLTGYYSGATNLSSIRHRLGYILRYSCARTLGRKLRLRSLRKVFRRFGPDLEIRDPQSGDVLASFPRSLPRRRPRAGLAEAGPTVPAEVRLERLTRRVARSRQLFESACALCGSSEELEVHHLRRLSARPTGRHRKGGPPSEPASFVTRMMRRMNRKQLTLCAPCHREVHRGAHDGAALKRLADGPSRLGGA